jgi:hypothetical protein
MPWVAAAASAAVSLYGAEQNRKSASQAASAQQQSSAEAISEQRRQFDLVQKLLAPYQQAGVPALQAQQALLGLSGPEAQQKAIAEIQQSPGFQASIQQGENAMLQNAAATGGLRGGNLQGAMAQFRPQMLQQAIENQYARLGGLTALGQQSAVGVGNAGMSTGANVGNLMSQMGAMRAGGILSQQQMQNQSLNQLAGYAGKAYNSPEFTSWLMGGSL